MYTQNDGGRKWRVDVVLVPRSSCPRLFKVIYGALSDHPTLQEAAATIAPTSILAVSLPETVLLYRSINWLSNLLVG
jgi:hypothetical protein